VDFNYVLILSLLRAEWNSNGGIGSPTLISHPIFIVVADGCLVPPEDPGPLNQVRDVGLRPGNGFGIAVTKP